jgi:hypothetical protein
VAGGALLAASACGDDPAGECKTDPDCGAEAVCLRAACIERSGPSRWSLEVTPGPQSLFASRELPDQSLGAEPATWAVDRKLSMMAELSGRAEDAPATPTSVGVVLAVPSSIPGRGDLKFEGVGTNLGPTLPYVVMLAVPEQLLGKMGNIDIRPMAPLDRFMCPFSLGLTLQASQAVGLPGNEGMLTVSGRLGRPDLAGGPAITYEARAFVADRLVSNVDALAADGSFSLRLQRSLVSAAVQPVRIELTPTDPMQVGLRFVTALPPGNRGLENLMLPAHPDPAPFIVPVLDEESDRPIAGVTVIFDGEIQGAMGGQARYVQVAQTNAEGNAMVRLIPGTVRQTQDYLVKAIPAGSSEAASRCLSAYSVAAVVTDAPRVGAPIRLSRRVAIGGRVLRPNGHPAGSVRVRAVPEGDLVSDECARPLSSSPPEATSGADGRYRVLLDPGQYRLEYEPASGAPLAMAAELGLSLLVSRSHDFTLPAAVLVEGRVVSPDGQALADAEVKAWAPGPDGRAWVRGAATSGPDGAIRLVLPKNAAF